MVALLLASNLLSHPISSAHPCDPDSTEDMHEDFNRTALGCGQPGHQEIHHNVIEVDGGRDRELEFKVYPPPSDRE